MNYVYTQTKNPDTEESNALYMLGYEVLEYEIVNQEWNDWLREVESIGNTHSHKVDILETVVIRESGFLMLHEVEFHPEGRSVSFTAYKKMCLL